jgi:hypothetical protein
MPAIRPSNCMILGAGHPPFVFASNRPSSAIRSIRLPSVEQSLVHSKKLTGVRPDVKAEPPSERQARRRHG